MQAIEIRHNKKKAILYMASLVIGIVGITVYVTFFGKAGKNYNTFIGAIALIMGVMAYSFYRPVSQILKNQPVLTLSNSGIEIDRNGKQLFYSWEQITEWYIENDDNTWYLHVQTAEDKKSVSISLLEKKPKEIEELIREYIKKGQSAPTESI